MTKEPLADVAGSKVDPEQVSASPSAGDGPFPASRDELVENIQKANADWTARIGQLQRTEADFALRLARCGNPVEAVGVCSEWMAHRIDSAVSMQRRFLDLWLNSAVGGGHQKSVTAEKDAPDPLA